MYQGSLAGVLRRHLHEIIAEQERLLNSMQERVSQSADPGVQGDFHQYRQATLHHLRRLKALAGQVHNGSSRASLDQLIAEVDLVLRETRTAPAA